MDLQDQKFEERTLFENNRLGFIETQFKRVLSGNATITDNGPTHSSTRKRHRTLTATRQQWRN